MKRYRIYAYNYRTKEIIFMESYNSIGWANKKVNYYKKLFKTNSVWIKEF